MNLDQGLQTFVVEGRELLEEMERALLALDSDGVDHEIVNAVFRVAHTIKGSAGMVGLDQVVSFTHVVEGVLDRVRDGKIPVDVELVALLLACRDHVSTLIDLAEAGRSDPDPATQESGARLLGQLRRSQAAPLVKARTRRSAAAPQAASVDSDYWHISLRFSRDVFRHGMDPLSFIRYLGTVGEIAGIVMLPDSMPAAAEMDPESCYLGFEIALDSDADKATIEGVFELVRDDCKLRILPPHSRVSEYVQLIDDLPAEGARLGEMLLRCGIVTVSDIGAALAQQQASVPPAPPIGEILIEQGAVEAVVVEAALAKQQHVKDAKREESRTIRVDAEKLDHLIDLVGELITAAASTGMVAHKARIPELEQCTMTLSALIEEVRESALQLRMVKIGATFNRFRRVVHDVARDLGKEIELAVSGEETELDKTMVERLTDPLTHLVRNAIDHGIEPPNVRAQRSKPAKGTVRLHAYHDSGSIVIQVSDDGGGLNRDKIVERAVERGLVEPGRVLSDAEICGLIFEPGFSTADKVSNLSGRGVGMDVVKRNITAVRGSVHVGGEEGQGTIVTVRLPLTLAIINGFLVGLGKSAFVVPLEMIDECVELAADPNHDYTNLRGRVLPLIRLRELFGLGAPRAARESVVVVRHAGERAGLVVDSLLGEFQTVIKPLGKFFAQNNCISGSSILGSGEVALILDVPALVQQATRAAAE